jgi:phosphoglycerate dehydrogenase-like enzyme
MKNIFDLLPQSYKTYGSLRFFSSQKGTIHMKKCAILNDYQQVAFKMADWSSIPEQVSITSYPQHFETENELVRTLFDYEILVVMRERTPLSASIFAQLPNLKLVVTSGMRNAAIDLDAAAQHGIVVSGTNNHSEPPVELTWGLILALTRHIVPEVTGFRAGHWQNTIGVDLKNKQLGLLGLGKTGIQVAKIGQAFGMNVVAWSQNLKPHITQAYGVALAESKEALLRHSDIVSVHLILSDRTRNLISATDFSHMRQTAYLINTSRAGIVDQNAMIHALQTHQIRGAAADVFEQEPLSLAHVLRQLPNFIGTPHLGYVTERNYKTYYQEAVENITAYLDKKADSCVLLTRAL